MKYLLRTLLLFIFTASFTFVSAETPCGNIIAPEDPYEVDSPLVTTPISNCSDPFGESIGVDSPYTLTIEGAVITESGIATVPAGGTQAYDVEGLPLLTDVVHTFYIHDGDDYRYVDTNLSSPNEDDYRTLADAFFEEGVDTEPYIQAAVTGERSFETEEEEDLFFEYLEYVEAQYVPELPLLGAGTYTLVSHEFEVILGSNSLLQNIFAFVIPTAHADTFPEYIFTLTFTIVETPDEPLGASNVLFLPGIMGSRLYEESDVCDDHVAEQERWISRDSCDQLRLSTTFTGVSINDIYTTAEDDSVIDEVSAFNLYKTFFNALDAWRDEEEIIVDFETVAYDWRLKLDDLLKARRDPVTNEIRYDVAGTLEEGHLYQTLSNLAQSSPSGKVTIVAHSNGGLLAKTFLSALEAKGDPLVGKIDNLILVGSPQLGTPGTLLGMLQGDEIGPYGLIVSQQTTRHLMSTMPFAFHLLPSASYFNSDGVTVDTPVITFEEGELTTPWANTFGSTITDAAALQTFLGTDSGREKPVTNDLHHPEVVDTFLFSYANTVHHVMNSWVPPPSMRVYQIAGVGLPTKAGITYFTDRECISRNILKLFKCTGYQPKLGYRVNETIDGDETVVTPSALAMSDSTENVERWWLNLELYNRDTIVDRQHKDIFEVDDVINFVRNTIQETASVPYEYLTNVPAILPDEDRLIFSLHSPLDMSIVTDNGEVVSSTTVTIDGAFYKRYGELQHISLPNTPTNRTLKLQGLAFGSFTLEIEEYSDGVLEKRHTYSAIPSSTSTKVTMDLLHEVPLEQAELRLDYDGDSALDIIYNTEGEIIPEITYKTLTDAINKLPIKSSYKKLMLGNAKIAERYYEKSLTQAKYKKLELLALHTLKQQVLLYGQSRVITTIQKDELLSIIGNLANK